MTRRLRDLTGPARREASVAMCQGKESLTHERASQIASRMRRRKSSALQPYRCPLCRSWHVGRPQGAR